VSIQASGTWGFTSRAKNVSTLSASGTLSVSRSSGSGSALPSLLTQTAAVFAVTASLVVAAGIRNAAAPSNAGAATTRRENLSRLVRRNKASVRAPPTMSPIMAVMSGTLARRPTACNDRWRYSKR
jgi:hypothetical protein